MFNNIFLNIYLYFVWIFCMCLYMYTTWTLCVHRIKKQTLELIELKFQKVVRHDFIQVTKLRTSRSKWSLPLNQSSSPEMICLNKKIRNDSSLIKFKLNPVWMQKVIICTRNMPIYDTIKYIHVCICINLGIFV